MPQQYPESESIDYITGVGDFSDPSFNQTCSELQKESDYPCPSKLKIPNHRYLPKAIEDSNSACCYDELYLSNFYRYRSTWYPYDRSNCLNSNENEYLNQACKFYENYIIPLNLNKHAFLVSC